jgi:hypothetical protein
MSESYDWVDDPDVPFRVLLDYVESLPELVVEKEPEKT